MTVQPTLMDVNALPDQRRPERLRLLITVKAAPTPSSTHGETVCVAGLRLDANAPGWIRLYPINFRYLEQDQQFSKYDVVTLDAAPQNKDSRLESWLPRMDTLVRQQTLPPWKKRRGLVDPHIEDSMCGLFRDVKDDPNARSLALIRPAVVEDLVIRAHPGWTPDEQRKIDGYVSQLSLFGTADRTPLEAPRYQAWYRYRCGESGCLGHEQSVIDWEFVAHQRHLANLADAEARVALRKRWLDQICAPNRDTAFYVGNQAKRRHVFMVIGVYYPPR